MNVFALKWGTQANLALVVHCLICQSGGNASLPQGIDMSGSLWHDICYQGNVNIVGPNCLWRWHFYIIYMTMLIINHHAKREIECQLPRAIPFPWWRHQMETFSALLTLCEGIPLTKASDAELWCFFDLRLNKRLIKQSRPRWFETASRSFWRHCNYIVKESDFILHTSRFRCVSDECTNRDGHMSDRRNLIVNWIMMRISWWIITTSGRVNAPWQTDLNYTWRNFNPHFMIDVITYPCLDYRKCGTIGPGACFIYCRARSHLA